MITNRALALLIHIVAICYLSINTSPSQAQPTTQPPRSSESHDALAVPLPPSKPYVEEGQEAHPIDWPTVLELASAPNLETELAVEKIHEAHLKLKAARMQWFPSLQMGIGWLHHDGRIQLIPGQIIDASKSSLFAGGLIRASLDPRKVCVDVLRARQQVFARSADLDKASRETLHEVSLAYVDLLAAQGGAAISIELADLIGNLVDRSQKMLAEGIGAKVEVLRNKAHFESSRQILISSRRKQLTASARLVQLLNMTPDTRLYGADENLVPVQLVDENLPEKNLIDRAWDQGPGISEIFTLMSSLEEQERRFRWVSLLPIVSMEIDQGIFGGGTGQNITNFSDKIDLGVGCYWDVTRLFGNPRARALFESQRRQARLGHQQLKAKLGAAIVVARESARKAKERLDIATKEVEIAVQSYNLSAARLRAAEAQSFEVLQAIAALGKARVNYLTAVIDFNRAQIQLQYLIGSKLKPSAEPDELATPGAVAALESQTIPEVLAPGTTLESVFADGASEPETSPPITAEANPQATELEETAPVTPAETSESTSSNWKSRRKGLSPFSSLWKRFRR